MVVKLLISSETAAAQWKKLQMCSIQLKMLKTIHFERRNHCYTGLFYKFTVKLVTKYYKFLLALSVRTQLRTAWIMTTKMTKRTKSRFIFELLSRSLAWYKHTSIEWFSFPIRSLIIRCSSTKGLIASGRLELEELWRRE